MPLPTNPDGTGVTGAGKFSSPETKAVYSWTCPGCGTKVTTPLEQGCPVCAERNRNAAKGKRPEDVTPNDLLYAILRAPEGQYASRSIIAAGLTPAARRTIVRALAYAAETQPALFVNPAHRPTEVLEKHIALAWAREMNRADDAETPPTDPPTP